jgi:hypothetical protein
MIAVKAAVLAIVVALAPQAPARHWEYRTERAFAQSITHAGKRDYRCLTLLWDRESGWNPWAVNQYSGAYGIPQALGHGHPYPLGRYKPQIRWGVRYIHSRYGHSCQAWSHEMEFGWY